MMYLPGKNFQSQLTILGAGYIAVELAGVLHTFGVKTDLFVRRDRPLRGFDSYIVEGLVKEMERTNLPLHTHKVPVKLEKTAEGITIHFEDGTSHTASRVIWLQAAVQTLRACNLKKLE